MALFSSHESRTFSFPTLDDDAAPLEQTCYGWVQGGCDICWSDVLPRMLAAHGQEICGGRTVVELGAGCGLVGLVASRFATRVDITDGDIEEIPLITANCDEHAFPGGAVCTGHFLDWGSTQVAEARASGALLAGGYDVVLAAQVVYVPDAIPKLAEAISGLLAPGGYALLYNDAVSCMKTQAECRALLDAGLAAQNLHAVPCELPLPKGCVMPHADAYILRITRA